MLSCSPDEVCEIQRRKMNMLEVSATHGLLLFFNRLFQVCLQYQESCCRFQNCMQDSNLQG